MIKVTYRVYFEGEIRPFLCRTISARNAAVLATAEQIYKGQIIGDVIKKIEMFENGKWWHQSFKCRVMLKDL